MAKLTPDYIKWVLTLNASQAQEEYGKLTKANKELTAENNASRKAMVELEKEGKKGSQEWKNLKSAIDQNSRAISENRTKMAECFKRIDTGAMSVNQLRKHLKDLQRQFNDTSKAADPNEYKRLATEIEQTKKALKEAGSGTESFKNRLLSLNSIKGTIIGFFMGIGQSIIGLVTGAFRNFFQLVADFEAKNSKLDAHLNTSSEEVKNLTKSARELGATTSYTASQVAGLQDELSKLGFAQKDILNMEGAVLKFAKAVDTDLPRAAAFAGTALKIFGKDTSETEDVLATFAVATTKTRLDFAKLETSLSTVGPVAASFGLSIEDTVALLGQLADAGFDASSAATATRNIILNLCDANGDLAKALGGPVNSAEGLAKGLQKLKAEGVDLAKALELTDKRSVAAFQTFINGSDSLVGLRQSITNCTAGLNKMSDKMGDNVWGALAKFRSAIEEIILKIGDATQGPLKAMITWLTSLVEKVGEAIKWMQEHGRVVKTVVAALVAYKGTTILLTTAQKAWTAAVVISRNTLSAFRAIILSLRVAILNLRKETLAAKTAAEAFRVAFSATPWKAILSALGAAAAAWYIFSESSEDASEALEQQSETLDEYEKNAKAHAKALDDFNSRLDIEKSKLLDLVKIAEDENALKEHRQKAINELNRICPAYNGHLANEGKQLRANKKALDEYVQSMEQRMRLAYYKDEYQKYINEQEAAKQKYRKANEDWQQKAFLEGYYSVVTNKRQYYVSERDWIEGNFNLGPGEYMDVENSGQYVEHADTYDAGCALAAARDEVNNTAKALEEFKKALEADGISLADVLTSTEEFAEGIEKLGDASSSTVTRLKEINEELKELRKAEPLTDEEYKRIKERTEALIAERKALQGKSGKNTAGKGVYSEDDIDQALTQSTLDHQRRQLEINMQNLDKQEEIIARNKEIVRYAAEQYAALESFKSSIDETHAATLDKIKVKQAKLLVLQLESEQKIEEATIKVYENGLDRRLKAVGAFYDAQQRIINDNVAKGLVSREAAELFNLNLSRQYHADELAEVQRHYDELEDDYTINAQDWLRIRTELEQQMSSINSEILSDTGRLAEKLREMTTDTISADGIKAQYESDLSEINATYDAAVEVSAKDAAALNDARARRIVEATYQYQEQMWRIKEVAGLTWADQYERDLERLKYYHKQGIIDERQYQKKRLELGVENAKKYFSYYSNLSSSMFSAIQDAEIAESEAKFDVLIQQAKNNGEDTTKLEQEKENKKLEIQKKYADVNFAIKVGQIIADTAVSIMKAFADLGPIGGAVAAAMLTATGAAQLATAKAERDKIKNMQPGVAVKESDSGKGGATVQRLLTGYSEGGYTGDGNRYEVAGVVHRGEYVVPKPIMTDPRVIDAVGMIEAIRNQRILPSTPSNGYADGGFTPQPTMAKFDFSELTKATADLKEAAQKIRAYVVLQDIDRSRDHLNRAQAPFTR